MRKKKRKGYTCINLTRTQQVHKGNATSIKESRNQSIIQAQSKTNNPYIQHNLSSVCTYTSIHSIDIAQSSQIRVLAP